MNDEIIKEGLATHVNTGIGGNLYLNSHCLTFKNNSLNFDKESFEISLNRISDVFSEGLNIICILLKDGSEEQFRVYKKNEWIETINNCISELKNNNDIENKLNTEKIIEDKVILSDDELIVGYNNIKFVDISDINYKGNVIYVKVKDTTLRIKTINAKDIVSQIVLQKQNPNSKKVEEIKDTTFGDVYIIVAIITILITFYANRYDIITGYTSILLVIIVGAVLALIPSVFVLLLIEMFKGNSSSNFECPNCNIKIKSDIFSDATYKTQCPNCKKELGIKHKYVYILTPDNEKEFEVNHITFNSENNKEESYTNYEELEKLKELLDKNIITEEEFNLKKKEILNLKD